MENLDTSIFFGGLDLTYEELKLLTVKSSFCCNVRLDLTYEELKPMLRLLSDTLQQSLDLTYEELKPDGSEK